MSGPACHWLTPRKFQGKPPIRNHPRTHSSVVQHAVPTTAALRFRTTESSIPPADALLVAAIRGLTIAKPAAAAPKYKARNAMVATAPGTLTCTIHHVVIAKNARPAM